MKRLNLPHCVGEYEGGNKTCDGNPVSADKHDQLACWCRDRCVALQKKCIESKVEPAKKYVVPQVSKIDGSVYAVPLMDDAEFLKLLDGWIRQYGVVNGKVSKETPEQLIRLKGKGKKVEVGKVKKHRRPCKLARKNALKSMMSAKELRHQRCLEVFEHYNKFLQEALPEHVFTKRREAIAANRVYVLDKMKTSRYMTHYYSQHGSPSLPLSLTKIKPKTGLLVIELPVRIEQLEGIGEKTLAKLKPTRVLDGHFITSIAEVDKEKAALIAEIIGRLVKSGKMLKSVVSI
jgi:hypothetical protein